MGVYKNVNGTLQLIAGRGGGGGGTDDYNDLVNQPQIAGVTLEGNKTLAELGIAAASDLANKVDKETGKGLSSNDYTNTDKGKVDALGTAASKNVPTSGDAASTEVVLGNDSRLSNSRPASDVPSWAKQSNKPSYDYSEINNTPTLGTAASKDVPASGDAASTEVVLGNDSRLSDARTPTSHNQAASTITAGTMAGRVRANGTAAATLGNAQVRDIYAGTADMTEGSTALTTGAVYLQYEA